jgi:hypothetical protein
LLLGFFGKCSIQIRRVIPGRGGEALLSGKVSGIGISADTKYARTATENL